MIDRGRTPRPIPPRLRRKVAGSFFAPPGIAEPRQPRRSRRPSGGPTEAQIQAALFGHLAVRLVPGAFAFHVPNGGLRSRVEAARMKGQGVVPGVPDIAIVAGGRVFFLELKSENGRLSPAQVECHDRLQATGAIVATAYGLDAALRQLETWGLLPGRSA